MRKEREEQQIFKEEKQIFKNKEQIFEEDILEGDHAERNCKANLGLEDQDDPTRAPP